MTNWDRGQAAAELLNQAKEELGNPSHANTLALIHFFRKQGRDSGGDLSEDDRWPEPTALMDLGWRRLGRR